MASLPGAIGDLVVLNLSPIDVYSSLVRVSTFWRNRAYREEVARVLAHRDIREDFDDIYSRVGESWRLAIRSVFVNAPPTLHGKVIYTARHNTVGMLRMLTIEYGIRSLVHSVELGTRDSPLHIASERGCGRYITMAASLGYDLEAVNMRNATPLHTACYFGRVDAVHALIEAKANVESQEGRYRQRPLHIASSRGFLACVQLLVEAGCKIAVSDRDLYFPVRLARDYNHHDIVQYLETTLAARKAAVPASSPSVARDLTALSPLLVDSVMSAMHTPTPSNGSNDVNDDDNDVDDNNDVVDDDDDDGEERKATTTTDNSDSKRSAYKGYNDDRHSSAMDTDDDEDGPS